MNFQSFFREENFLFRWCNQVVDGVMLSILWLFLSLPVVTVGPATAALYFTSVKCLRGRENKPYLRFFRSFRENLKVGVPTTLIVLPAAFLLYVGFCAMRQMAQNDVRCVPLYGAYAVALILPVGCMCYLFPLLGRFSFRVKELFVTALQLAVRHLPSTVVVVLLTVQVILICVNFLWTLLFLPTIAALFSSLFLERIFCKYLPPEGEPPTDKMG